MKLIKFFIIVFCLTAIFSIDLEAQVLDGAFPRTHVASRSFVPLPVIREGDAMWSKKIIRVVELREKMNHPLYFPLNPIVYPGGEGLQPQRSRLNLLTLMYKVGVMGTVFDVHTGRETEEYGERYPVYEANKNTDLFVWYTHPIPEDDTEARSTVLGYLDEIPVLQDDGEYATVKRRVPLSEADYYVMDQLWIIEEWFFDKHRSLMDVRIVAMLPRGEMNDQPIWGFWIPFKDYRPLFATHEVFNTKNDASSITFDDIFLKRRFKSYIIAEANNYNDRLITDYLLGVDAIREGERIQNQLFLYEHDQWEF